MAPTVRLRFVLVSDQQPEMSEKCLLCLRICKIRRVNVLGINRRRLSELPGVERVYFSFIGPHKKTKEDVQIVVQSIKKKEERKRTPDSAQLNPDSSF